MNQTNIMSEEAVQDNKVLRIFRTRNIVIAIALGLAATIYLFITSLKGQPISSVLDDLANPNWLWFGAAILILMIRDAAYVYRIRNLTNGELSWKGSLYTVFLWEFASAVTPSVVGGTAVAIFILSKEGIKFGKSLAYVMLTAILDNAYFLIAAPIILLNTRNFDFPNIEFFGFFISMEYLFYASYILIFVYTLIMAFGVLVNPDSFRVLLKKITYWSFLRKLRPNANKTGNEILIASNQLKGKTKRYWLKAVGSTFIVWTARYLMLNFLISTWSDDMSFHEQIAILSKQVIMWITLLISPSPGGAGLALHFMSEIFKNSPFVTSATFIVSLGALWRLFTYYTYLGVGALILPKWMKRVMIKE